MENKDLNTLRKNLPKGAITIISSETGLSVSMVSYVLSGKRMNDSVIDIAIRLIEESKVQKHKRLKRLKNAVK